MFDKTPKDWVVDPSNQDFLNEIQVCEGTQQYQAKIGTYKNGLFVKYKDSLGLWTIGYGHLILEGENYDSGLSDSDANDLLCKDLSGAVDDAERIFNQYKMEIPERAQYILANMVFQLGINKVLKFKNFLAALANQDYEEAAAQMKDSAWYKQTPNRVIKLSTDMASLAD